MPFSMPKERGQLEVPFTPSVLSLVGVMLSLFILLTSSHLVLQVRLLLATLMAGAFRKTASIMPAFCSSCEFFKTGLLQLAGGCLVGRFCFKLKTW